MRREFERFCDRVKLMYQYALPTGFDVGQRSAGDPDTVGKGFLLHLEAPAPLAHAVTDYRVNPLVVHPACVGIRMIFVNYNHIVS